MNQELEEHRAYEYWLASMQGISDLKKRKLREFMKCAKDVYYIEETQLKEVDFLSEEEKAYFKRHKKVNLLKKNGKNKGAENLDVSVF